MRSIFSALLLFLSPSLLAAFPSDILSAYEVALGFAQGKLESPELRLMTGRGLFDSQGERVAPVMFNFVGDLAGSDHRHWLKVVVELDGSVRYDAFRHGPHKDHDDRLSQRPELKLTRWLSPHRALERALKAYPDYQPAFAVPLTYHFSERLGGRYVLDFHWIVRNQLVYVIFDAQTGEFLEKGRSTKIKDS